MTTWVDPRVAVILALLAFFACVNAVGWALLWLGELRWTYIGYETRQLCLRRMWVNASVAVVLAALSIAVC